MYYIELTKGREEGHDRMQYRARVMAQNGREIFKSSEGYNNLADLEDECAKLLPTLDRVRVGDHWTD